MITKVRIDGDEDENGDVLPWKKVCHLLLSKISQLLKKLDNFLKKQIYRHQKIYKMSAIW